MPRKKNCPDCGTPMEGPSYMKLRDESKVRFCRVYVCTKCEKMHDENMTPAETRVHFKEFNWGSTKLSPKLITDSIKDAKKDKSLTEESEKVIEKIEEKKVAPLIDMLNRLKECKCVYDAYVKDGRTAPHMLAKGWKIVELHVVPLGRPPYYEVENVFAGYPKEGDEISEMIGERIMLKLPDGIHVVRIIENAKRLGHV